jgi:hypothetical protein
MEHQIQLNGAMSLGTVHNGWGNSESQSYTSAADNVIVSRRELKNNS